ncbi:hypothetical protein [Fulvimonas soli]|uniref:hypothetical protein n=1 Tax=Fulvimonas soli TaxID=155197 RepID=UPI000D6C42F9|nr:hypothetical protein [Fulvimonas soli]TNY25665.1 hypothetical protein BV497_12325 [Fulvimonas soli]
MIVPYIIESDQQAKVVTRAVIDSMKTMDASRLTTPLVPPAPVPPPASLPAATQPPAPAVIDTPQAGPGHCPG